VCYCLCSLWTEVGTFGYVQVEEVTVENGLNTARHNRDEIKEPIKVVAIDPVEDVETAVDTEGKQVMTRDSLRLARLADHEQLRENRDRFQIDGKRPEELKKEKKMLQYL